MITKQDCEKLWELVKPVQVSMLTTKEHDKIYARPMHLVQKEFEGSFYFFTELDSKKVSQFQNNSDVCLIFSCPEKQIYASVNGDSSINRDPQLIEKFWNPFVAAWFPQGKEDPSVGLIEIKIHQADYWEGTDLKLVQLFKYAKAILKKERPDMGDYGHIE